MGEITVSVIDAITNTEWVPHFVWLNIWYIQRYVELHPILTVMLLLLVSLIFFPALKNRVKSFFNKDYQGNQYFLWDEPPYKKHKLKILAAVLALAIAQITYLEAFFNPYKTITSSKTVVLLLPVFELDSAGRFKVADDSDFIQAEIQSLLDGADENEIIIIKRDEYPFRAFSPTTMDKLLDVISANTFNNYFYLYAIKHGNKYEKFNFLISPEGQADPGNAETKEFYHRYSNVFSQLLNSSGNIPQSVIVGFSTNIFYALLSQIHTTEYTRHGKYQAAEDGIANAVAIADRTCVNMRKSQFVSDIKVAISFCDDLVKELTHYRKLAAEKNLKQSTSMQLLYVALRKNPFLPFKTEKQYIKWLTSQEQYSFYSRYIFLLDDWPKLDSGLEKYIGSLVYIGSKELPIEKLSESLDDIIPEKSWVKSYYLFLVSSIRSDIEGMRKYQRELAEFDKSADIVGRAAVLIEGVEYLNKEIAKDQELNRPRLE